MIRAGRRQRGQRTSTEPATPDSDGSRDDSSSLLTDEAAQTVRDDATREDEAETPSGAAAAGTDGGAVAGTSAAHTRGSAFRRALAHTWLRHLLVLLIYEGAGIAVTWPRFTWLADGKLPATADVSSYVWNLWWVSHQLGHLGNPFFTTYQAAPVGTHLAFSTLMPLAGWLTTPVTVLYGPVASFTLLTLITPGLLCYTMYRAAKLWLNEPGALVAGAFFGLSSMLMWQDWYHINIALGTIFIPVTIEAAVRLRRDPHMAPAIALGAALGASILINQESTVVAFLLSVFILVPWLVAAAFRDRALARRALRPLAAGALVALVIAVPLIIAMIQAIKAGAGGAPPGQLALNYAQFGVSLPTLFAPSPRLANFGLGHLAHAYSYHNAEQLMEGLPTFGAVLTVLALLGLAAGWRKRSTWAFTGLWLVSAVLALGTSLTFGRNCQISAGIYHRPGKVYGKHCTQYLPLMTHFAATKVVYKGGPPNGIWRPVVGSNLMPYTWLVRVPGLAGLREADRFAIAGLIGAAMLAGLVVTWLSKRKLTMPLIAVVVALGAFEAGWSGAPPSSLGYPSNFGYHGSMHSTLPELERPLVKDHTTSIVVDVPFGLRGGVGVTGQPIAPSALLIAAHDKHPRAIAYLAWVSKAANKGIAKHAFYRYLYVAERSGSLNPVRLARARADLRTLHVGWVVEWRNVWTSHHQWQRYKRLTNYLIHVGFVQTGHYCVQRLRPGATCPSGQRIWLFRYEPGGSATSG